MNRVASFHFVFASVSLSLLASHVVAQSSDRVREIQPQHVVTDSYFPIPPHATFKKVTISQQEQGVENRSSGPVTSQLVYSNTHGSVIISPLAGIRIADDIVTTASHGCSLDRYSFQVTGDRDNDPVVDRGPFTVHYALYETCPGAIICPPSTPDCPAVVPGTQGQVSFADDGTYEVEVVGPANFCSGGPHDGSACSTDDDCLPLCEGGINDGQPCRSNSDCFATCQSGSADGEPCNDPADCPDGFCNVFDSGTCGPGGSARCATGAPLPSAFYLGVSFDRNDAGVVVGAPPLQGYSADLYDSGSFPCSSRFGGFPNFPHASMNAKVYVKDGCDAAFPAFHSSVHSARPFSPGPLVLFADDIQLEVNADECQMVAYEVRVKGLQSSSSGAIQVELFSQLDDTQPEDSGVIPGTRTQVQVSGSRTVVRRRTFPVPLSLADYIGAGSRNLFAMFKTTSSNVGPINSCKPPSLGSSEDTYFLYQAGSWTTASAGATCHASFDITIFCDGTPPAGSCCDTHVGEDVMCVGGANDGQPCSPYVNSCEEGQCVGESVCREVPIWNCSNPDSWTQGFSCEPTCDTGDNAGLPCSSDIDCPGGNCAGAFCVGGIEDGSPCTRAADCPSGECVGGPFALACGSGTCCTYQDNCLDATARDCFSRPVEDRGMQFNMSQLCEETQCPFGACLAREGECTIAEETPGCEYPQCCTDVCLFDEFCCSVAWDETCVVWSQSFCQLAPPNDSCFDDAMDQAAILVPIGESVVVGNRDARDDADEPDFCCLQNDSVDQATGRIWFRFVAPQPTNPNDKTVSVEVNTCETVALPDFTATDTAIQVYSVRDSDRGRCNDGLLCSVEANDCIDGSTCQFDEQAACQALNRIACNNDAGTHCEASDGTPAPLHSRICLQDLVPGDVFYVMVAGNGSRGAIDFSVSSPCTLLAAQEIPNDHCTNAEDLTGHDLDVDFDHTGGVDFSAATIDCSLPSCAADATSDLWYEWTAPTDGILRLDTCQTDVSLRTKTSLSLYEGCDCPIDQANEIDCSNSQPFPCNGGSIVHFSAKGDTCYKIQIAGRDGVLPNGSLALNFELHWPAAEIEFVDPQDGVVDARQPHGLISSGSPLGIDQLRIKAPVGSSLLNQWAFCEVGAAAGSPSIQVDRMKNQGDGTYVLYLTRALRPGTIVHVTFTDGLGATKKARIVNHPGDVNADGLSSTADIPALIDILAGNATPAWENYSADLDHSGNIGPPDLLRLIDLLQGAADFAPGWKDQPWPDDSVLCP